MSGRGFATLRHRDFRLYWLGQSVSVIGTQMQRIAVAWHVYQLTHSAVALGLIGACRLAAVLLLSLPGGVLADHLDRKRVMLCATWVSMAASLMLWAATRWQVASLPLIYTAVALNAGATAFGAPARHALVPTLVPAGVLQPALTVSLLAWDVAGIVGPAVGGVVLAASGPGAVYLIDAVSYGAVIASLWAMRSGGGRPASSTGVVGLGRVREGLRFVFGQRIIAGTMVLDFFATLFGQATVLFPIFAADVLHVGAQGLGLLSSATAAGSVLTGLVLASRPPIVAHGRALIGAVFVYGLATVVFGVSTHFALTLIALAVCGAADTVSTTLRQTIRQRLTPDAMRGRVTGINMIFFQGGPQLGEFESGVAAALLGPGLAVALGGVGVVVALAIIVAVVPELRGYQDVF